FMLKLRVEYPSREEERQILDRMATTANHRPANPVVTTGDIMEGRTGVDEVYGDDKVRDYIVSVVFATREPKSFGLDLGPLVEYGASPRATLCLTLASRAHAFLQGRGYVTPQDVKAIAPDVLRHRVIVSYEAEAEEVDADEIVRRGLARAQVPESRRPGRGRVAAFLPRAYDEARSAGPIPVIAVKDLWVGWILGEPFTKWGPRDDCRRRVVAPGAPRSVDRRGKMQR